MFVLVCPLLSLLMEKNTTQLSFSSIAISTRKVKNDFFNQINLLVNWSLIDQEIKKHYNKGHSVAGRRSYSGLLLFKMSLLQTWYNLSDYEVEDRVNDSLSFMHFVGLTIEDSVPDNTVLSRFRTEMTKQNAYEKLMIMINTQLENKGILLKKGAIIDASITDSPRKPRGKKEFEIVEDRADEEVDLSDTNSIIKPASPTLTTKIQSHVDIEGAWIKKAGKLRYGFKKHTATDEQGLITAVLTTPANESDVVHLCDVVAKIGLKKGSRVRADKGYSSQKNRDFLKEQNLKDGIMFKAIKNKPLEKRQIQINKIISQVRYRVERTFGSMVRWFGAGVARYVGIAKMHTQHLMEALAHNLYRAPGIAMCNAVKTTK